MTELEREMLTSKEWEKFAWEDTTIGQDIMNREIQKSMDTAALEEMKCNGTIAEPIIICSSSVKDTLSVAIPNALIIATSCCEKDKAYVVTDKKLAQDLRMYYNMQKESEEHDY